MFLSNSLYIGKSYTIFFYEKVVKWCSYQKLHKNPCEYKAPINSQPIRTGKFINFLIYMIVYSARKRYNVRENTNMHILFGNYSEKIVYVCCRSLRGSVDWNPSSWSETGWWEVAPFAGAWIEIGGAGAVSTAAGSLPSRERGLKSLILDTSVESYTSLPSRERGLKLR